MNLESKTHDLNPHTPITKEPTFHGYRTQKDKNPEPLHETQSI